MIALDAAVDARRAIFELLRRDDVLFDRVGSSDRYVVVPESRSMFVHVPVIDVELGALADYVEMLRGRFAQLPDPIGEAVGMTALRFLETLTVDHGGGRNATVAAGLRRRDDGRVEFYADVDHRVAEPDEPCGDILEWRTDRPR